MIRTVHRVFLLLAVVAAAALLVLPATAKTNKSIVSVKATNSLKFILSTKTVKAGSVVFKVTNTGSIPHDFKIAGKKTKLLSGGQSATLTVVLKKGKKYPYECTVPGHAAAGMKGVVKVI